MTFSAFLYNIIAESLLLSSRRHDKRHTYMVQVSAIYTDKYCIYLNAMLDCICFEIQWFAYTELNEKYYIYISRVNYGHIHYVRVFYSRREGIPYDTLSYRSLNIFIKRAVPVRKNNFKIFVLPPGQSNRCNLEDLTLQFNQTSQHQTCELDV